MIATPDANDRRTARSVLVAVTLIAIVAGVAVHRHAWIVAAGSVAMLTIGTAWPWLTVRALRADAGVRVRRTRAREGAAITIELRNRMPLPLYAVAIDVGDVRAVVIPVLGGWRCRSTVLEMRPSRRGVIDLATARAACSFPFGLVLAERPLAWRGEVVVWPERGRGPFPVPRRCSRAQDRPARAAQATGGGELAGIRGYRAGDPMRHVHWKATARHDRLISRESHDGPRPPVRIVLDLSVGDDAARERAIARAAGAAEHYVGQGFGVELIVGDRGRVIVANAGPASLERLLDSLARLDLADDGLRAAPSPQAQSNATLVVSEGLVARTKDAA